MGVGGPDRTAFEFQGQWQQFVPIALTNSLLTIITLGIYRFWATARERRYLWSQTRFIDDQLEWTGTGKELFIGAIMAFVLLILPLIALQFLAQYLLLNQMAGAAAVIGIALYISLFWLVGFAIYRGLRYRLSRTSWHGIHGGSDEPGFRYANSFVWKTIVGFLPIGLLIPWASTRLFKERWESMSFGPHNFLANPEWLGLMRRFALFYVLPILGAVLVVVGFSEGGGGEPNAVALGMAGLFLFLFIYIAVPIISLIYFAAYARVTVGSLRLAGLEFAFTARSTDWLLLALGNLGLWLLAIIVGLFGAVIFGGLGALMAGGGTVDSMQTLMSGAGSAFLIALSFLIPLMLVGPFIRYRNWAFFMRHMEAGGEVSLADLTQSETAPLRQGEGLLDAFDVGAI